ncbi:MAG TPA: hypothetical protein VN836_12095 [Verrucomicrobiae bacterium]|nr:hypothetical protein [Verrucomicrobiae bacterium]
MTTKLFPRPCELGELELPALRGTAQRGGAVESSATATNYRCGGRGNFEP